MDFKKLKAQSGKNSLDKLTSELQKLGTKQQGGKDERFWQPTVDKAEVGYAIIRFLPPHADDDETAFVRLWNHAFQGPTGSWYFENSLTTLGKPDPVSEYNTKLWNSGLESDKAIARKYKRKLNFISNIFVIKDSGAPENEGKVKLYKYGKMIFDKLNDAMNPAFPDQEPLNPFDFWEGANFTLRIAKVDGYRNYDRSSFGNPCPLGKDEEMEAIWKQQHSLLAFIAPDQFKPYDVLKEKFEKVIGLAPSSGDHSTRAATLTEEDEVHVAQAKPAPSKAAQMFDEDDDETAKWFASLDDE